MSAREPRSRRSTGHAPLVGALRFHELFDASQDLVVLADLERRILAVNPALEQTLGLAQEELLGRDGAELIPPELRQRTLDSVERKREGVELGATYETELVGRDGRRVPVEASTQVITIDGAPAGVLGVLRDLTERRRAERALRESEARFRTMFEASPLGLSLVDRRGRAVSANRAMVAMLGYTKKELRKLRFDAYTHPDDVPRNVTLWQELLDGRRDRYELEKRYLRKDGSAMWGRLAVIAVRNPDGDLHMCFSMVEDISGRKRAEEELRRLSERLQLGATAAASAIYEFDVANGRVIWTEGLASVFGYSLDGGETTLDWWLERVHPDDRERVARQSAEVLVSGDDWESEYRFRARDGRYRSVWDRARRIPGPGGSTLRSVGAIVDVTERRLLEDELRRAQRLDAIGRFAGGIAHDFNNLLTAISGYADLARSRPGLDAGAVADIDEIAAAAGRAAALTRQLLAFSRHQVLQPVTLDLNTAVVEMAQMLRRVIGEHVELVTVPAREPALVRADPGQVDQVILNLAVNARDAMPAGGRIEIAVAIAGDEVVLSVADTGAGVDPGALERIFEPFFTTKQPGEGSGLGLSTVYGIVGQTGGRVEVESEPGAGATFRVVLPRCEGEAPGLPERQEPGGSVPAAATVLLVEDDGIVRRLAARLLEDEGYRVLVAANGQEALERAGGHPGTIDLVLTDVVMPRLAGPGLVERIRAERPSARVVYMSGYADEGFAGPVELGDGVSFLAKPFTRETLRRTVAEALAP